jgi:hypothetical protein
MSTLFFILAVIKTNIETYYGSSIYLMYMEQFLHSFLKLLVFVNSFFIFSFLNHS